MIHHAQLRTDTRCRPGFHPTDPDVIYASSQGRLRISRDGGRTFSPIGDLRESLCGEISINPSNPAAMLVGTRSGRCWQSTDAGNAWNVCSGPRGQTLGFHFDQTGGGRVALAATETGIWRTDDGGRTWVEKTDGLPWTELQGFAAGSSAETGRVMLYCTVRSKNVDGTFQGGIYRSRDHGDTWQRAMGAGINMDTEKADQWAYGSIAQYHQLLATDAKRPRIDTHGYRIFG